ncbi:hypothetical protein QQX98_005817 [Neonectria punicea]|uniref:beta-glucosidase n=1 Tax=Neonectria punicea TaxID=979145 RepID=A0ABR1H3A2_9HYPO
MEAQYFGPKFCCPAQLPFASVTHQALQFSVPHIRLGQLTNRSHRLCGKAITKSATYLNLKASRDKRVKDLLSRMCWDEKVAQLGGVGGILSQNNSLDVKDYRKKAQLHNAPGSYLNYTEDTVPMLSDMYGEDPWMNGEYAAAYISTMQEEDFNGFMKVATTIKHYLYGMSTGGINQASMLGGVNHIYNILALPYINVMKKVTPASVMPSYATVDGIPAHSNSYLLQDLLRQQFGFDGVVVSDADAIAMLHLTHKTASTLNDAGIKSLAAGVQLQLELAIGFPTAFEPLTGNQTVDGVACNVNDAVSRILDLKFKLGLFDKSLEADTKALRSLRSEKHLEINEKISSESIVLLKNDGVLPLDSVKKLAVLGPLADVINTGTYAAWTNKENGNNTLLDAIKAEFGADNVNHVRGVSIVNTDDTNIDTAVGAAKDAGLAIVALGSVAVGWEDSLVGDRTDGEGNTHASLKLPGRQDELLEAITATGVPTILVLTGGQAFELHNAAQDAQAILHGFHSGEETGRALVDIITGRVNPSGKLTFTFPVRSEVNPVYYNREQSDWQSAGAIQFPNLEKNYLYPFGYGLSFTTFEFSDTSLDKSNYGTKDRAKVTVKISNTGKVDGKEVVQVYFRQKVAPLSLPVKRLVGFSKVLVSAGSSKTVEISIPVQDLGYWLDGKFRVDKGTYEFFVVEATFDDVKAAGLKSVRVPVTWAYHFTGSSDEGDSPDWTVDPDWLQRVYDVVGMVTSRGLYTIVNVHHDSALWADFTATNADLDMIEEKFYRLWYQIGMKLACTSSHVAFEPINEPRGESDEYAAQLLRLNNIFLQAINDARGFNSQRVVTLGGLGQDMQRTIQWFESPSSEYPNPYALQVHYYAPYDFTSAAWGKTIWGSGEDKAQRGDAFAQLRSAFPDIPIVIGEWLVSPVHSEPAARWRYYDFLARTSMQYDFAPIVWDTGNDILDRTSHSLFDATGLQVHLGALEGTDNSLPGSTTDTSATGQFSSAFAFHSIGDAIQGRTLPFSFNGNTVTSITVNDGALTKGTDYSIVDAGIQFHSSVLSDYFGESNAAGAKATASVSFTAGATIPVQLVLWDFPTVPISSSVAVAGSEVSVAVNWKGIGKPAAVAAFKADRTPLVDEWTVYLPPLGRGRTTFGAQWTWNWDQDGITITEGAVLAMVESGQSVTFIIESYPRVEGNLVNYTLTV